MGAAALASPELAGSTSPARPGVFHSIWRTIGDDIGRYRNYPRIVGETGGKDFILAHPSADPASVAAAIVRGSFEYQGQKCSASSRLYLPSNLWREIRETLEREVGSIAMGDVSDFTNFMGAVIDESSFGTQRDAIAEAREAGAEIVAGGGTDDSEGWFVEPTVIKTDDPGFRLAPRRAVRTHRHRVRLRRVEMAGHARARRLDERLRVDGRGVLERPLRH